MGRADVSVEVSLLSMHLKIPFHENLYQAFNIYFYIKFHLKSKLLMNPERIYLGVWSKSHFKVNAEWFDFKGENKKELYDNALTHYDKDVDIHTWVDVNHAGYCLNSLQPHGSASVHKHFPNCLVFKTSSNNRAINIWLISI